jgi:hypothetical protein
MHAEVERFDLPATLHEQDPMPLVELPLVLLAIAEQSKTRSWFCAFAGSRDPQDSEGSRRRG